MENKNIGVINEVGDLGLGFYPINESEQEQLREEKESNKED